MTAIRKECDAMLTELLDSDWDVMLGGDAIRIDKKLTLLGWGPKNRGECIQRFQAAEADAETTIEHQIPLAGASLMRRAAYQYAAKLGKDVLEDLKNGIVDDQVLESIRGGAATRVGLAFKKIKINIRQELSNRQAFSAAVSKNGNPDQSDGMLLSRKRSHEKEDMESSKKSRMDSSPVPQDDTRQGETVIWSDRLSDATLNTAQTSAMAETPTINASIETGEPSSHDASAIENPSGIVPLEDEALFPTGHLPLGEVNWDNRTGASGSEFGSSTFGTPSCYGPSLLNDLEIIPVQVAEDPDVAKFVSETLLEQDSQPQIQSSCEYEYPLPF